MPPMEDYYPLTERMLERNEYLSMHRVSFLRNMFSYGTCFYTGVYKISIEVRSLSRLESIRKKLSRLVFLRNFFSKNVGKHSRFRRKETIDDSN